MKCRSMTQKLRRGVAANCIIAEERMGLDDIDESWLVPDTDPGLKLKKFAPEEMLTCDACLRANAPTRRQCMYCGAALGLTSDVSEAESETVSQPSERDQGLLVVCRADPSISDEVLNQLATQLRLKTGELRAALNASASLPLASVPSAKEANQIVNELRHCGVETFAIPEKELQLDNAHIIIRAVEIEEDGLIGITTIRRERLCAPWNELELIVTGWLVTQRVHVDERRAGGSVKQLDRREMTDDQFVIDLHVRSFNVPWRILVNNFDFSCLGERKGLTAFANVKALIEVLTERSQAVWDDSYARVKPLLANVWPLQSSSSEGRSRRPRAGRHDISKVNASDNEAQFNHYSRLVWACKRREFAGRRVSGDLPSSSLE